MPRTAPQRWHDVARRRWSFAVTRVAIVAIGALGVGLATPAQAAADAAAPPGSALSHLASTTVDDAVSDLTAPSAPSSFWVVPSLLSAVVIIVGLIFRQRERARDRARDG